MSNQAPPAKESPKDGAVEPVKEEQKPRFSLRRLSHQVGPSIDRALAHRWGQVFGLTLLIGMVALLLGPSFRRSEPLWKKLREGSRAENNIKAIRNFQYFPGEDELERRRTAASELVLPVFDHQADLAATLLSRVNRAFQALSEQSTRTGINGDDEETNRRTAGTGGKKVRGGPGTSRDVFSKLLGISVSKSTFAELRKSGFSPEVRATMILLVGSAMDDLVVAHRGTIQPFRGGAINIRHLVGGRLSRSGEEQITSFSRIHDLQRVRDEIRHQSAVHGAKLSSSLRLAVTTLAESLVVPNLVFNPQETTQRKENARRGVEIRPEQFVKGQVIVPDGDEITKKHLRILRTMEGQGKGSGLAQILIGIVLFSVLILGSVHRFAARQFRRFACHARDLVAMGLLLVGLLTLVRISLAIAGSAAVPGHMRVFPYMLPIATGAMLVRLLVSAESAALFAVVAAALGGLMIEGSLGLTLFYFCTGLVGGYGVHHVQSRSTVLRAGLLAGVVGAGVVLGFHLFGGQLAVDDVVYSMLASLGGGVLSAFATLALLPALEWSLGYTTDITLLELANLNHPLLRELMLRAPGTYHHSMVVGSLAETACEAIGANGLLARVASNYHDVGKIKNASYFAENQRSGDNPHNRLRPSMSGLIIRNHVKDGIELMRDHGLPRLVIDTATQHHGTAQIAFFYHKALEQKESDEEVREEDYRYPGPKPQSREAGVLMLADGVEAAARSLTEPTTDRVRALVQRVINARFTDGQLDHCDVTLRDLHVIARSFLQVLRGIYHARPTYPWQRDEGGRRTEEIRKERRKEGKEGGDAKERRERTPTGRTDRFEAKGRTRGKDEGSDGKSPTKDPAAKKAGTSEAHGGDEPESQRTGADDANGADKEETPPEGSKDIRRLGLN